ncbi:MAG: T9SS type A sorting domain-containing protein [Aureispira sp.]|nr:T9SS type A sorting domain-containing protein [Aureispira sp.]
MNNSIKLILLFAITFIINIQSIYSQYTPFDFKGGETWIDWDIVDPNFNYPNGTRIRQSISCATDSINGKEYRWASRKIWYYDSYYNIENDFAVLWREDTLLQKVYYYSDGTEKVLFDFSLVAGDNFNNKVVAYTTQISFSRPLAIPPYSETIHGAKKIKFTDSTSWVETVGSNVGGILGHLDTIASYWRGMNNTSHNGTNNCIEYTPPNNYRYKPMLKTGATASKSCIFFQNKKQQIRCPISLNGHVYYTTYYNNSSTDSTLHGVGSGYLPWLLREDTLNKKIYRYSTIDNTEELVFDFNLKQGDTTHTGKVVSKVLYESVNNTTDTVLRRTIYFQGPLHYEKWIEGIGSNYEGFYLEYYQCQNPPPPYPPFSYSFSNESISCLTSSVRHTPVVSKSINIFPNPTTDRLTIQMENTETPFYYRIYTIEGLLVQKGELVNNSIELKNDIKGLMILQLQNSTEQLSTKFIRK